MDVGMIERLAKAEEAYRKELVYCMNHAPQLFKDVREKYSWSQRRLAELLDCDFSYISKIENGHLRPGKPTLSKLQRLVQEQEK